MTKVITYGTYDLLHYGHIRLLERAKALGDYLIVGVTADDFDKTRGKINVQQSLMERVEAVRALGLADEIIVEEYEGQKIDDIKQYDIDIFTVGSDWKGKFDYLNEFCKVVYLDRTRGVSSSEIRNAKRKLSLGLVGDSLFLEKVATECEFVNGIRIDGICTNNIDIFSAKIKTLPLITKDYDSLLKCVDAVYIRSQPPEHYLQIKSALMQGKHVLCESPLTLNLDELNELREIADSKELILMEALKTAYATAYKRLLLLVKSGKIGDVVSIDATCTSLINEDMDGFSANNPNWDCIYEWGPTALLPIFQLLGKDYHNDRIVVRYRDSEKQHDGFIKGELVYRNSIASFMIANDVKSEGSLIISGTNGYIYVPSPWWKTDYFEIRYENPIENKRYFYQLDGEGIRYEFVAFVRAIEKGKQFMDIDGNISESIVKFMQEYVEGRNIIEIE